MVFEPALISAPLLLCPVPLKVMLLAMVPRLPLKLSEAALLTSAVPVPSALALVISRIPSVILVPPS